ncbi:hypothetical protein GCM10008094_04230 [Aidingimonas halophila]|nr:hypothetical protein GCM10008094_04230 [Aidingimonas halophila]
MGINHSIPTARAFYAQLHIGRRGRMKKAFFAFLRVTGRALVRGGIEKEDKSKTDFMMNCRLFPIQGDGKAW